MGASPLRKGSGAEFKIGEIVKCNGKKSDPNAKFVVMKKLTPAIGGIEYKIAPYAASRKDFSDYEGLLGMTRKSHEIESLGTFVPQQLKLQPTTVNLFAGHFEAIARLPPKQDWKLELKATTAAHTDESEILDRLIREAIRVLGNQKDWNVNYAGCRSKLKLWEVVVFDTDGRDVGSLHIERMIEAEDFDTVDPNENFDWLGEHEGFWWRACPNLETELYERDLVSDLERLAQPFLNQQEREFKSCSIDALGPEAKALIAAINNLPALPTKNSAPQKYEAYWDVQGEGIAALHIGFSSPEVLLGHIWPGYGKGDRDFNLTVDGKNYHLGGGWNQLLNSPGRYQGLADLLKDLTEGKADDDPQMEGNSDPYGGDLAIGLGLIPTNIPAEDIAYARECLGAQG